VRPPVLLLAALALSACATIPREPAAVLRGELVLEVVPNPLRAVPLGDDLYELTFDIVMREQGGVALSIEEFTVDAIAFRTVTVQSQTFPASYITDRGYPASIAAGKYLRFSFTRRWNLPTRLLLSGASARVSAKTIDANGARSETAIRVGIEVAR
jgi:hypothetical protein